MFASTVQHCWKPGFALTMVTCLVATSQSLAHEGPPFPILMDRPLADYMVSVWADPDIGEARFFIVFESPGGGPASKKPSGVSMWIEPLSGRLVREDVKVEQQSLRNQLQFIARPCFDQQDEWKVGFRVADRNGMSQELTTTVKSTPPGYGPWDMAIYLFPFLVIAGFWASAIVRLRKHTEAKNTQR